MEMLHVNYLSDRIVMLSSCSKVELGLLFISEYVGSAKKHHYLQDNKLPMRIDTTSSSPPVSCPHPLHAFPSSFKFLYLSFSLLLSPFQLCIT